MQSQHHSQQGSGDAAPKPARPSTNNDANLLANSLRRLSLYTATNTPLPQSPSSNSPRNASDTQRLPASPGFAPNSLRRSSSVMSLNRSSSPALGRKSSNSSMRGDAPGTPRRPISRRSSFNPNQPSPGMPKSPLQPQAEEKPPLRACDVADEYFKKDLALHDGVVGAATAGTIVIVHDQCYGHRYSRPKTNKSTLSMIVERPERILASVLGISAAYVRLGERHAEGSNPPHPHRSPSEHIPFKIRKTSRTVDITSPVVTNVHGPKWMEELKTMCMSAERKLASSGKELSREGPSLPGQPPKEKFHEGDLYLCSESLNAFQGALGGVLDAVDAVFQGTSIGSGPSRAFVCVRPPGHHCSADFPSGFCWLNNVHVGIEHAVMQYGLTHAAIIDFDLHHGDGSQAITWARNKKVQKMSRNTPNSKKTSIGYFSLHDINSYPCEWGEDDKVHAASLCMDNAHGQSIWNVHLQTWKTEQEFWKLYEEKYVVLIEKARQYLKLHTHRLRTSPNQPPPKAAIFLSAGFDASEWESQGMRRHQVNVPTEFYARFTRDVVRLAHEEGTGVDGRIISVLEGGYSDRALTSGVLSHLSGLCHGQVWSTPSSSDGLGHEMIQRLGSMNLKDEPSPVPSTGAEQNFVMYDPQWWHESSLLELENLINPAPVVVPKKPRTGPAPTYSSPTQSFTAKVVDPSKLRRNVSGNFMSAAPSRAPTPPPPEVDWATASHALSKLLIPSGRQTRSCRPEDLSEPKVKKEKPPPAPTSVHVDPSGRQLRGRKPATKYAEPDSDDDKASVRGESRASRRKTIADLPLASVELPAATRTASRRMSIASSIGSVNGDRSASRASNAPTRKSVTPAPGAPANGLAMKKARATTTAAARITKNEAPVPRVPSGCMNKSAAKEKENDVNQLAPGPKRITLKLPAKEKEENEKQKALEAERKKAGTKITTRKTPAARTTKTTTTKKGHGRPTRASKPPSPVEPVARLKQEEPIRSPEPPKIEHAATAPLEQPQPQQAIQPSSTMPIAETERRPSSDPVDPPTELAEINILPDRLPKPTFTAVDPLPMSASPPRPDTPPPPPPPPSNIPQFVNYGTHTFGATSSPNSTQASAAAHSVPQAPLQWLPPNTDAALPTAAAGKGETPMSPSVKRHDLPTFEANGVIPFAANPNAGSGLSAPMRHIAGDATKKESNTPGEEKDIWEVPVTPAR
ncbi:Arginase/deacetylase [Zopfia rhizophila CBS 207.26]|uniref:Arginase/deacetylase n=1 Tax=Zopfia rhizophila CBS 207.26 TaxID=1314779 RepID=A0A6A6DQV7_9PEZI|nr:Arginase/deacetylase [Zopfia rhizophila CBS 207.26]